MKSVGEKGGPIAEEGLGRRVRQSDTGRRSEEQWFVQGDPASSCGVRPFHAAVSLPFSASAVEADTLRTEGIA